MVLPATCLTCGAKRSMERRTNDYGTPWERSYLLCKKCGWRVDEK